MEDPASILPATFCHVKGISLATERLLWQSGITNWNQIGNTDPSLLSPGKLRRLESGLRESQQALAAKDFAFFHAGLPKSERWRLIPDLTSIAFVDIETTGLQQDDHITTIALGNATSVKTYVHGETLPQFAEDIKNYEAIVTFNGSCFDLPILRRELKIDFPQIHLDLRFLFSPLGIKGGLKKIETRYRLNRSELAGVDGYTAVLLWQMFKQKNRPAALETLLAYNVADIVSLAQLLPIVFNEYTSRLTIQGLCREIDRPTPLKNPHCADSAVLSEVVGGWHAA